MFWDFGPALGGSERLGEKRWEDDRAGGGVFEKSGRDKEEVKYIQGLENGRK